MSLKDPDALITPSELARICRVHKMTVYRWIRSKSVAIVKVGPNGTVRIEAREALRLIRRDVTSA